VDIDRADHVLLVGFEPEEESPIVFLRINKQVRKRALKVTAIATKLSIGVEKLKGEFVKLIHSMAITAKAHLQHLKRLLLFLSKLLAAQSHNVQMLYCLLQQLLHLIQQFKIHSTAAICEFFQ